MERLTLTSVKMDFFGTKHLEFAIGLLKFSAELRNKVRTEMSSFSTEHIFGPFLCST